MNPTTARGLWGLPDVRAFFLTTAAGFGALLAGAWGSARTDDLGRQVTWTVVAIVGVIVIGTANFFWLLAGRRAVGLRRAHVLGALEDLVADDTFSGQTTAGDDVVAVPGSARYHRPSCLLVNGKQASSVATGLAQLEPCEMCLP